MFGKDGYVVRDIKNHSKDKLDFLRRYTHAFLEALKKQKPPKYYLDLFSGPGICFNSETQNEDPGSPLIAIKEGASSYHFEKYIFVDINKENIDALRNRIAKLYPAILQRIEFIQSDCNDVADEIYKLLPQYSFTMSFIDPTGLDIHFDTIKRITDNKRADLIINFATGTSVKRNLHMFMKQKLSKLDKFLGTDVWKEKIKQSSNFATVTKVLAEIYKTQLESIGYSDVEPIADMQLVKSTEKHLQLYYLVFASKSERGHGIWRNIIKKQPAGQRSIF